MTKLVFFRQCLYYRVPDERWHYLKTLPEKRIRVSRFFFSSRRFGMADCIFCKIVQGEIPCAKVYEDEHVLSFLDINPINPGHTLVIPKKHYDTLFDVPPDELTACTLAAQKIGKAIFEAVGAGGLNFLQNNFEAAGQLIRHAHFHLIPRHDKDGFITSWSGKPYLSGEMEVTLNKIREKLS